MQTGLIQNAHNDLVTDAAYDFYGLRLATCSLDHRIKVWQLDESNGTWSAASDWKAHDAAVSRVSWAHPEFGSVIASGSFDRTVKIWEETSGDVEQPQVNGNASAPSSSSRWVERAVNTDAKGSVRGVEFAPHHFGLKLATIASDNNLRVYECLEAPSLTTWQLTEEVDVLSLPSTSPASASHTHTIAMATPTQTNTSLDGPPASLVASALQQHQNQPPNRPGMGNREADGGWCISWCKDRYWGEIIAAGCGVSGVVKVIQLSSSRRPTTLITLDPSPISEHLSSNNSSHSGDQDGVVRSSVTSVAWAPSCGRSYHLVATGGRDGHVRIWRLKPPALDDDRMEGADEGRWTGSIVADFDHHKFSVGRVEWNITGTVLSSAGSDGRVRLWKATSGNVWRPAGHISVEQAEEQQEGDVDMDDNNATE
ncbi:WD40 repeat-like protein [Dentipellis sp. KUC8613]|nr:WD40 repeat-like protein [Dentipellis sp. KUC8613]